jgi:hypothetical protein
VLAIRARAWASRAGLVALVVIAAQVLWRAVVLNHGFFSQDDFLVMSTVHDGSWSDRLTGEYAGGFSPGGSALVWLCMSVAPLGWGIAAGAVLLLESASSAVMWLVITRLLGERWLRIPFLALYALTTLTLWTTQWWVLGLEFWAAALLLLVAVWAMLKLIQDSDRRWAVLVVGAIAAAMLFDDRAVLDPIVLAGTALLAHGEATVRGRAARAVREQAWVWIGLLIAVAAYAVLRWQVAPIEPDLGNDLGEVVTAYLRHGLAEVFAGPWTGSLPAPAYLVPESWVVALNGALLLGLAGATLQRGGPAARASWGLLVVFVGASLGLLALIGKGDFLGSLGLVHRFAAELAPVVVICVAGALSGVTFGAATITKRLAVTPERLEGAVAVAATVLVAVSAAVSTAFLAPNLYHSDSRAYVENLREDLRQHPQVVLLDGGVPENVISPWYVGRARVSSVIAYAPESPVFDLPSHALRMVGDDGRIVPLHLEGAVRTVVSDDRACGYPVRDDGTWVPMRASVPPGRWVLRIGYYTDRDGFATVDVAGSTQRFAVRDGLNAIELVVEGGFDGFLATLEGHESTLCLTNASAGVPLPDTP